MFHFGVNSFHTSIFSDSQKYFSILSCLSFLHVKISLLISKYQSFRLLLFLFNQAFILLLFTENSAVKVSTMSNVNYQFHFFLRPSCVTVKSKRIIIDFILMLLFLVNFNPHGRSEDIWSISYIISILSFAYD